MGQCSSVKLKECVVCMSDVADGVIMPCGHGGICYECAVMMMKAPIRDQDDDKQRCHLCRETIE